MDSSAISSELGHLLSCYNNHISALLILIVWIFLSNIVDTDSSIRWCYFFLLFPFILHISMLFFTQQRITFFCFPFIRLVTTTVYLRLRHVTGTDLRTWRRVYNVIRYIECPNPGLYTRQVTLLCCRYSCGEIEIYEVRHSWLVGYLLRGLTVWLLYWWYFDVYCFSFCIYCLFSYPFRYSGPRRRMSYSSAQLVTGAFPPGMLLLQVSLITFEFP